MAYEEEFLGSFVDEEEAPTEDDTPEKEGEETEEELNEDLEE